MGKDNLELKLRLRDERLRARLRQRAYELGIAENTLMTDALRAYLDGSEPQPLPGVTDDKQNALLRVLAALWASDDPVLAEVGNVISRLLEVHAPAVRVPIS